MCWLHEKTRGKACLPGCPTGLNSARGNRCGFGPQDYWIHTDIDNRWYAPFFRFYVFVLVLLHGKHVHDFQLTATHDGRQFRRCKGCGQWQDLRGQ